MNPVDALAQEWEKERDRADRLVALLSSHLVFSHERIVDDVDLELALWREDRGL